MLYRVLTCLYSIYLIKYNIQLAKVIYALVAALDLGPSRILGDHSALILNEYWIKCMDKLKEHFLNAHIFK